MDEEKIIRQCAACRLKKNRCEFIKITVNTEKIIKIMPDSKFVGRSVYLCKDKNCIENAFKKGKIFKILKIESDETLKEKIGAVLES